MSLMILAVGAYAMTPVELTKSHEKLVKESIALIENLYLRDRESLGKFIFNKEAKHFFTNSLVKRLGNTKNNENMFYPIEIKRKTHPTIISTYEDSFAMQLSRKVRAIFGTQTVTYYVELDVSTEIWKIYHIELPNGISYY